VNRYLFFGRYVVLAPNFFARGIVMSQLMERFRSLRDWLSLRDYEQAMTEAEQKIVARYSRGNVCIQNGWFIDKDKLNDMSRQADAASESLKRFMSKSA
jgi:hypothetical protein